jgi:hypothetical protein
MRLPLRYRRGTAPTVLTRDRDRYGRPPHALAVEAGARRFADRVRAALLRLRAFLRRLRDFFRRAPRPAVRRMRAGVVTTSRSSSGTRGDGLLTALVLATTAALGLEMLGVRQAIGEPVTVEPRRVSARSVAVSDALEARVDELANAIAVAEGYFAIGIHDGHTLPYVLNNPGSLKKPALGATDLPTWEDTGLIWFPDPDMGWNALRHQVRLMLTGTSGIYAHSDSLLSVGDKYADGDLNWGVNVAMTLGVPPAVTLGELAPPE